MTMWKLHDILMGKYPMNEKIEALKELDSKMGLSQIADKQGVINYIHDELCECKDPNCIFRSRSKGKTEAC